MPVTSRERMMIALENGRQLVFDCFAATCDHAGHIIAPSDHFFHGDPANRQSFADACREYAY